MLIAISIVGGFAVLLCLLMACMVLANDNTTDAATVISFVGLLFVIATYVLALVK